MQRGAADEAGEAGLVPRARADAHEEAVVDAAAAALAERGQRGQRAPQGVLRPHRPSARRPRAGPGPRAARPVLCNSNNKRSVIRGFIELSYFSIYLFIYFFKKLRFCKYFMVEGINWNKTSITFDVCDLHIFFVLHR